MTRSTMYTSVTVSDTRSMREVFSLFASPGWQMHVFSLEGKQAAVQLMCDRETLPMRWIFVIVLTANVAGLAI